MSGVPARVLVAADTADATREGVILVETVRWLVDHTNAEVQVLLFERGSLTAELEAVAPTTVVADLGPRSPAALVERLWFLLGRRDRAYRRRASRLGLAEGDGGDGGVVYLHSVLAVQTLRYLSGTSARVLCRLPPSLEPHRWGLSEADQAVLVTEVDRFLVETAGRVRELTDELDVAEDRIHLIPHTVVPSEPRVAVDPSAATALRASLGLDPDAFVVGAFSPSTPTDPPDLSLFVAALLTERSRQQPTTCLWVMPDEMVAHWVEHDLEHTEVPGSLQLVRSVKDTEPVFRLCDMVVYLTRVDEPAPLAYLDVAADGIPLLCFEGSDLAPFAGGDSGLVVRYLDVTAIADGLAGMAEDPERCQRVGDEVAARVLDVCAVERYAERLWGDACEVRA